MKLNIIFIALFALVIIKCTTNVVDVDELGKKITLIRFGSGWDGNNLTGIATSFSGTTTIVYYEIGFEDEFSAGGMIRKTWIRDGSSLLGATSFMPKRTRRICGEIHKYELQNMDAGSYAVSVYWYSSLDGTYQEYPYDSGVNRTFTVE